MTVPLPSIPVTSLPEATSVANNDIFLVRKGFIDYQVQAELVRQISIADLDPLSVPAYAQQNDYMIIARGGNNYRLRFAAIGLEKGTVAWFYQSTAPNGWIIKDQSSGTLLAIQGATATEGYNGSIPSVQGTWQQANHTLTLQQMPQHRHGVDGTRASTGSGNIVRGYRNGGEDYTDFFTKNEGGSQPHNHGNTWRPLASVGILCEKSE